MAQYCARVISLRAVFVLSAPRVCCLNIFDVNKPIVTNNKLKYCYLVTVKSMETVNDKRRHVNTDTTDTDYKNAIQALNGLQQNPVTIEKSIKHQINNIHDTKNYLLKTGISLDDLDKLSVIHVSGTKGKGSTCALTESILRSFGLKTGFYSSPHLISVTERFRINGQSITKNDFTRNFWKVYNNLNDKKDHKDDMPAYFKFLTILSFHIFFEKNVDVAIIEVGIGGENDCTNVLRNTKTIGITSLGLEHTRLLGNTIKEIAWQKAGIIKSNSNVFTVEQPEDCFEVISQKAKEFQANLFMVPDFSEYKFIKKPKLQINNKIQNLNASLAIQLAYDWLKNNRLQQLNGFVKKLNTNGTTLEVTNEVVEGLEKCYWPGRCQIIEFRKMKVHLDGAHTVESLDVCADWFKKATELSKNPKCLIFNATGDRDSKKLMKILMIYLKFDMALFVPNIPFKTNAKNDNEYSGWSHNDQIKRAEEHSIGWLQLNNENESHSFPSILDAFIFLKEKYVNQQEIDVLITGSLNLIGAALLALEEFDK